MLLTVTKDFKMLVHTFSDGLYCVIGKVRYAFQPFLRNLLPSTLCTAYWRVHTCSQCYLGLFPVAPVYSSSIKLEFYFWTFVLEDFL